MWRLKLLIPLLLCIQSICTMNNARQLLPPNFDQICNLQHENENNNNNAVVRIRCNINKDDNQTWRLDTLRDWIMTSKDIQSDRFSYEVICGQSGGSVSVPLPMKCPRLHALTVRNCNITDIFEDFGKSLVSTIPDTLAKLEIIDSVMVQSRSRLYSIFAQIANLSSDYECFHDETIERLIFRNVSYHIMDDMEEKLLECVEKYIQMQNLLSEDGGNLTIPSNSTDDPFGSEEMDICDSLNTGSILDVPKRIKDLDIRCNYKKLRYLEDSSSSVMSLYQFRFLAKYNKFPVLTMYNSSANNIDVVPEELLDWSFYFSGIQYIDLSHNRIRTLKFKSRFVEKLVNDTYINLQYNNITTLLPSDLEHLKNQMKTFIDIRNNPIRCDCDLKDFISTLSEPSVFSDSLQKYKYIKDMQCHTPDGLAGKTLKSLTVDDLDCGSNIWIAPFVALTSVSVILLTVILLGFLYRREIRILFYTRLNIQMPGVVYVGLGPKTYHAFVSYSNEDEDWVIDVLCKQLEEPNSSSLDTGALSTKEKKMKSKSLSQFKLCLHARDFVPGMTIIENIINSVEKSRHTLIVLTENFVQSKWAMEEFYQAYNQSVMERRRHLIIIIRGELPQKMDPILKRCLKTFTYLKTSDKLFYDRLAYSLSTENRMTKEESSREEEILKCRKNTNTTSIDMGQDNDSGISNTSEDSYTITTGQLNSQTSVVSTTNSEMGLIEATHL